MREIVVDNFAGGGGASTGIEIAMGRSVDVDKDELLRALRYDRGQYQKGYMDGYRDALDGKDQEEGGEESECF